MNKNTPINELDSLLKQGDDALDQSIALNRIVMTILESKRREDFWLRIALIISLLVNLVTAGMFMYKLDDLMITETTLTTTITQDTEGEGNNVYQSGEKATYVQGGLIPDGETDNNDHENYTDGQQQEQIRSDNDPVQTNGG